MCWLGCLRRETRAERVLLELHVVGVGEGLPRDDHGGDEGGGWEEQALNARWRARETWGGNGTG